MRYKFYIFILTISFSILAKAQGLILPAGAFLVQKNGNIILGSNWKNNGTFLQIGGSLVFGGVTQTLGGTTNTAFKNIFVLTGSNTTINTPGHSISNSLKANGTLNANGNLTLLSIATQTAFIDGSGTGQVLGNVTMERYIPSGFGYKYLSSPFQAATVMELAEDMDLAASFPTLYRYDEDLASSGWVNYVATSGSLVPLQGYAANLGTSAVPKTIDISGVVSNGTITSQSLYNHNRPYTKGFNLAGNPYPSPIDWNASSGWVRTNIDNAIYYFNASTTDQYTGTYSTYINGISSDGIASNIIPSMQGFFIHVSNGAFPVAAQLITNNNVRIPELSPVFHSFTGPLIRVDASYSDGLISDPAVIYFDNRATSSFNKRLDAVKLLNTNKEVPNLYAVSTDSEKLSIRAIDQPRDSLTILPLGLKTEKEGWVTFNTRNIQQVSQSMFVYLHDNVTHTYQDLRKDPGYRLYLTAGQYENRFSIVFSMAQLESVTPDTQTFDAYFSNGKLIIKTSISTEVNSSVVITNMMGQRIWQQPFSGNGSYTINTYLSNGTYIVTIYANKEKQSKKIYKAN